MGWNYRRSTKIMPGVRMNFSKTGVGFSFGPKGAKVSISPRGRITSNIGIPGTGLRYTQVSTPASRRRQAEAAAQQEYVPPAPRSPLYLFMRGLTWSTFILFLVCSTKNWTTAANVLGTMWWVSIIFRMILWSLSSYLQGRPRPGGPAEAEEPSN
jgi:hypothetical protein